MFLAVVDGFRYHSKIDPMLLMQHGIVDVFFRPTLIQDSFLRTMGWFGLRIGPLSEISESSWDVRLLKVTRMAIMKPATATSDMNQFDMKLPKDPVQCRRCRRCLFLKPEVSMIWVRHCPPFGRENWGERLLQDPGWNTTRKTWKPLKTWQVPILILAAYSFCTCSVV